MEREEIVRSDFPIVRKGWSPEAVEAHLNAVADWVAATVSKARSKATPAADAATERVGAVLAAAESSAAEIVEEAEAEADRIVAAASAEADQIRAAARAESEETVNAAGREASGRIEQAHAAVEGLISQADKLRSQMGALGRDLAASVPGFGPAAAGEAEGTQAPDEPTAASGSTVERPSDPEDEPEAEAEPGSVPEAEPEWAPEAKAGSVPGARAASKGSSDEELIAQLRGTASEPAGGGPAPESATPGSENAAVRLVAMNMALDGAPRERIAERIEAEFGSVDEVDGLLDDVLRRAGR